jgi:hypothetical protein
MTTLEDQVGIIVNKLVDDRELFTALDVSNKVKGSHPLARHREVRDIVRKLYTSDMQVRSYGRTPIEVILDDGSKTEALLYHSLSDAWDLAVKYDDQRRTANAATQPVLKLMSATISIKPRVKSTTAITVIPTNVTTPVAVTATQSPKDLWDNLFSATRLFPKF